MLRQSAFDEAGNIVIRVADIGEPIGHAESFHEVDDSFFEESTGVVAVERIETGWAERWRLEADPGGTGRATGGSP